MGPSCSTVQDVPRAPHKRCRADNNRTTTGKPLRALVDDQKCGSVLPEHLHYQDCIDLATSLNKVSMEAEQCPQAEELGEFSNLVARARDIFQLLDDGMARARHLEKMRT